MKTALTQSLLKCRIEGNTVFLPTETLTNYADVKKALVNSGGTYKRNAFVFKSDAKPYIDRLTAGESVNIKKEFQFFETPSHLADKLVEMAYMESNHEVLEPSAGQGAIVKAIHRKHGNRKVTCFELMQENRDILEKIPGVQSS